jgi:hypothetical protein
METWGLEDPIQKKGRSAMANRNKKAKKPLTKGEKLKGVRSLVVRGPKGLQAE